MSLFDTLAQMVSGGSVADHQIDHVAQNAPAGALGGALSSVFSSNQTPPIGQMVGQLFGNSNGAQQSGMLNQLLSVLGPAAASGLAGGVLGRILSPGATQITPEQAAKLTPQEVQAVVDHAHETHPGVADQLGHFYAEHSGLIKTLGGAALLMAMTHMKDSLGNRN